MVRCLIVDDSPAFLRGATNLLEAEGIVVVGVASNSAEALRLAQDLQPDVTLVDIDLGGESGFELAGRLREHGLPRSGLVLISTRSEEDYGGRIAASEACGFVAKGALSANAIRRVTQDCR
jgi:DNA-binding NarL/FixJ family response regulator